MGVNLLSLTVLAMLLGTAQIHAENNHESSTAVIQDYLKTNPINREAIEQTQDQRVETFKTLNTVTILSALPQDPKEVSLPVIYPVRSKKLTPGIVARQQITLRVVQPLFLIGDDDQSKAWLQQHAKQLQQLHAQGFVVNVENRDAMQALRQLVPSLSLYPLSSDALADALHLQHYPVLITNQLIEQ